MTVTLNLNPETVHRLSEKAASRGQTLEAYLDQLATEPAAGNLAFADQSPVAWIDAWRAWASSHRILSSVADDSRESIYSDQSE
ncbi:MAG: hypothetical protein EXS05_03680 [Planctomycetaceae bacterium]|nr:hypothetical protein [Planctomycetaceae bacterium]